MQNNYPQQQAQAPAMQQAQPPARPAFDFFDPAVWEHCWSVAHSFAQSTLVPKAYINNPGNCMIAVDMANRMKANPLMVMQNLYVVHGNPGWSAQFLVATFNASGKFSSLRYEFKGDVKNGTDTRKCRAYAVELSTGETLTGTWISMEMAEKEGWSKKNGSKWLTMPEQMLRYRAATFFIRAYAPEIAMGLQTAEEIHDTWDAEKGNDGVYATATDLNAAVQNLPEAPAQHEQQPEPAKEPTKKEVALAKAIESMNAVGMSQHDAEQRVGKLSPQWTVGDCKNVSKWCREIADA